MEELIFSTCNSGNPDVYNVAKGFKKNNKIAGNITAWDGGTVFSYSEKDNIRGAGKNNFWNTWKDEKIHQPTWWEWTKKNTDGTPVRKRKGKVVIEG